MFNLLSVSDIFFKLKLRYQSFTCLLVLGRCFIFPVHTNLIQSSHDLFAWHSLFLVTLRNFNLQYPSHIVLEVLALAGLTHLYAEN